MEIIDFIVKNKYQALIHTSDKWRNTCFSNIELSHQWILVMGSVNKVSEDKKFNFNDYAKGHEEPCLNAITFFFPNKYKEKVKSKLTNALQDWCSDFCDLIGYGDGQATFGFKESSKGLWIFFSSSTECIDPHNICKIFPEFKFEINNNEDIPDDTGYPSYFKKPFVHYNFKKNTGQLFLNNIYQENPLLYKFMNEEKIIDNECLLHVI